MRPRNASAFTLSRVGMHRASLGGFISSKWCTPSDGGRQRVLRFRLGSFLPLGVCFSHFSAIFGCFACIHRLWAWDLNGMACLRCKGRRPPTSQEAEADGVAVVPPGYQPGEASICALALPQSVPSVHSVMQKGDMVGFITGKLTVLASAGKRGKNLMCRCRCECGRMVDRQVGSLRSGRSHSCGCDRPPPVWKHGRYLSRIYRIWISMRQRCLNPRSGSFPRYGGRSITVCPRWDSFITFAEDMGEPPEPRSTIDRIDNDKPYCPGNCRWASYREQMQNVTKNVRITANGKTLSLSEWSRQTGIPKSTLSGRLQAGLQGEAVLSPISRRWKSRSLHALSTSRPPPAPR